MDAPQRISRKNTKSYEAYNRLRHRTPEIPKQRFSRKFKKKVRRLFKKGEKTVANHFGIRSGGVELILSVISRFMCVLGEGGGNLKFRSLSHNWK